MSQALVITGTGAVSAYGVGVEALWEGVRSGRTAITTTDEPAFARNFVRHAAWAPFDPAVHLAPELVRVVDRFAAMALVAAGEAVAQSRLAQSGLLGAGTAIVLGTGIGGAETSDKGSAHYHAGVGRPDPMSIPKIMPNAAASHIAMRYGITGTVLTVSSACSSSAQAIGLGLQLVRAGLADRALVGGAEAMLTPAVMRAWEMLRVLTPGVPRPFSLGRDGMALGEGAGVMVIEREADALQRGVPILGRLLGYGTTSDAKDLLRPDAHSAARAMQMALDDADIATGDIGYVNAHGTGTVLNDSAETEAMRLVFGGALDALPISSTKPLHGHTIGAAGVIEALVTLMALNRGVAPPTINWLEADPACVPDCVPNVPRPISAKMALSNSFAFGGINASLVLGRA